MFAPPVEAKALLPDFPTATLSCKSGKPKVLDPSPAPYVVPITANKAE